MPSGRKERILAAVVELYNETGEPVGSKRLMEVLPDEVSSATIRNEMAQLAEQGYLEQPHTSSGRIPSPLGYRYYIDHLLPLRELPEDQRRRLAEELSRRAREPERLLENAGKLLAELTACTALCVPAAGAEIRIKRVEIAPLGRCMAMLALLATNGTVKSKVVRSDAELGPETLEAFSQLVAEHMIGRSLESFTPAGIQSLAARAGPHMLALAPLLIGTAELAEEIASRELLVGEHNLFHHKQLEPNAAALLQYLQNASFKQQFGALSPAQVKVLLGAESPQSQLPELRSVTVLVSPYAIGGDTGGLLGIVGPLRMDYAKIIPGLRFVAAILGDMLTRGLEE